MSNCGLLLTTTLFILYVSVIVVFTSVQAVNDICSGEQRTCAEHITRKYGGPYNGGENDINCATDSMLDGLRTCSSLLQSCLSPCRGPAFAALDAPLLDASDGASGLGSERSAEAGESSEVRSTYPKPEVWLFSVGSVIAISVGGFICVLVLPSMCTVCYNHFQQFLVAMAVGTLSGDAVLHLIPHAFFAHEEDEEGDGGNSTLSAEAEDAAEINEQKIVMKGTLILAGLFLLYTIEQLFAILPPYIAMKRANAKLAQQRASQHRNSKHPIGWTCDIL